MSREVPASMDAAWRSSAKIGSRRPTVRATIQRQNLRTFDYDTAWAQGGTFERDRHTTGQFASMIFGDDSPIREIPNIISCDWERQVGTDAASCTLVILNSAETPLGEVGGNEFDQPGYYTYSRGKGDNRWGHEDNGWTDVFVPDMTVKTYEGYGSDTTKTPGKDPFLMPSGTWLIDRVTYGDDTITLEMRDLGRLLLDQSTFPPAVPFAEYPLSWVSFQSRLVPGRNAIGGKWLGALEKIGSATSSNELYVGEGLTNAPYPEYVTADGGVEGHLSSHPIVEHPPFDEWEMDDRLIWRSTGQDGHRDFVWWEFEADDPIPLAAIRLRLAGGPYRVYISIHNGTKWMGKRKIDYRVNGIDGSPGNVDIDARIPFVKTALGDRYYPFEVMLPRRYMAKKIRLTFSRLQQMPVGEHPFRAGLRELKIYTADDIDNLSFERDERVKLVGNYGDYTHIVKWVCAWAGWFWPPERTGMDFIKTGVGADNERVNVHFLAPDPAIVDGRVWGDFMRTGITGEADLGVEMFDKKPMMDIINYVRDLTGYLFFIDETGGVVWRMPNLWELGNYVSPASTGGAPDGRGRFGRTSNVITLDDGETLLSYETTLDSSNLRERIFVANNVGGVGSVIKGYNPYPVGLRRVAGWTDQHFANRVETKVMAEMIAIRQMFTYRTGRASTPGNPAIQVDDQIRIFEETTNETYYHYVLGIKSSLDMESGEWTYDLQTHWLGENPESGLWVLPSDNLQAETKAYLAAVGYKPKNDEDNGSKKFDD